MSPYIHNCDGLCTRTDHHMLLPIVLYMVVAYNDLVKLIIILCITIV